MTIMGPRRGARTYEQIKKRDIGGHAPPEMHKAYLASKAAGWQGMEGLRKRQQEAAESSLVLLMYAAMDWLRKAKAGRAE